MTTDLEWYGASVQLENISSYDRTCVCSIDWAYMELKARSEAGAVDKLKRLFRDDIKITYCQLI